MKMMLIFALGIIFLETLISWGIGTLICLLFNLGIDWTFWHALLLGFICFLLKTKIEFVGVEDKENEQ